MKIDGPLHCVPGTFDSFGCESRSPALSIALPIRFWDWLGVERVLTK